jgi:hypothetical protein
MVLQKRKHKQILLVYASSFICRYFLITNEYLQFQFPFIKKMSSEMFILNIHVMNSPNHACLSARVCWYMKSQVWLLVYLTTQIIEELPFILHPLLYKTPPQGHPIPSTRPP